MTAPHHERASVQLAEPGEVCVNRHEDDGPADAEYTVWNAAESGEGTSLDYEGWPVCAPCLPGAIRVKISLGPTFENA